jgi:hypothetical protein
MLLPPEVSETVNASKNCAVTRSCSPSDVSIDSHHHVSIAVVEIDEIMRFSSHSGRVWAIVILNEAGMLPDFIKSRLCWIGDSYRLYLRDTSILQQKHLKALERASTKFTALFGENRMTLPDVVPVDNTMAFY